MLSAFTRRSNRTQAWLAALFFACVLSPPASFANPSGAVEFAAISGTWYNPDRNGEGLTLQALDNGQVLVNWYTYPGISDSVDSEQSWIQGLGVVNGQSIRVGQAYKAAADDRFSAEAMADDESGRVVLTDWGRLDFILDGPDSMTLEFDGQDGFGSMQLSRLSSIAPAGLPTSLPPSLSGAWYDPASPGNGWFVEILSAQQALVYKLGFNSESGPNWNVQLGEIIGRKIVVRESLAGMGTGFGNGFDAGDVKFETVGAMTLDFADCNSGTVNFYSMAEGTTQTVAINRLTHLHGYSCQGELPVPNEDQLTLMSHPSDPAVAKLAGEEGTIIDVFGQSGVKGDDLSLSGAKVQFASGGSVRMHFENHFESGAGLFDVVHSPSGSQFRIRHDEVGEFQVTAVSSGSHPITTRSGAFIAGATNDVDEAIDAIGEPLIAVRDPEQSTESGQAAQVNVAWCGESSAHAVVDILVGQSDAPGSMTIPAFARASDTSVSHVGQVPVFGQEQRIETLERRCQAFDTQVQGMCVSLTGSAVKGGGGAGFCSALDSGEQSSVAGLDAFVGCAEAQAAVEALCAWTLRNDANSCDLNEQGASRTLYRQAAGDLKAVAHVAGVTGGPVWSSPVAIDESITEYQLPEIEIGEFQPSLLDFHTAPLEVYAGESFEVVFQSACLAEGAELSVVRQSTQDAFSCRVSASGSCSVQVGQGPAGKEFEDFEVSGPGGLSQTVRMKYYDDEDAIGSAIAITRPKY